MDSPISDDFLIQAARRRILKELEERGTQSDAARVINNVYGGGAGGGSFGPPGAGLGPMEGVADPFEYGVTINRRDVRAPSTIDPETGEEVLGRLLGWDKTVHRFRSEKTPKGIKKKVSP